MARTRHSSRLTSIGLTVVLSSGCFAFESPCDDVSEGSCVELSSFALGDTVLDEAETTSIQIDFVDPADAARTLRLTCEAESDLEDCVRAFTMPGRESLPRANAVLSRADGETASHRGNFRFSEIALLTDGESYRLAGRVDELFFDEPRGLTVLVGGDFDVVLRPPAP